MREKLWEGFCLLVCVGVFFGAIASIAQCDARNSKERETAIAECARNQCNWINGDCFCCLEARGK